MNYSRSALVVRFALTLATEVSALMYFLLAEQGSNNPLLIQVFVVQPVYMGISVCAYFLFICFDKLEESVSLPAEPKGPAPLS